MYCHKANRVSYEAKYAPVPMDTSITTLAGNQPHASNLSAMSAFLQIIWNPLA